MENRMYLTVSDKFGTVEYMRLVEENEPIDLWAAAEEFAESVGLSVDLSEGDVPSCSGDFRVEFRHDPYNSTSIYCGASFFFGGGWNVYW